MSNKKQMVVAALVGALFGAVLGIVAFNNGWLG